MNAFDRFQEHLNACGECFSGALFCNPCREGAALAKEAVDFVVMENVNGRFLEWQTIPVGR